MKKKVIVKRIIEVILIIAAVYLIFFGYIVFTLRNNRNTIKIGDYKLMAFNFENAIIVEYTGSKKKLKIPRKILFWEVTEISREACKGNDKIETVFIPNTVKTLGADVFRGCSSLKEVYIEDGGELTKISGGAFMECENLEELHLPEGITEIGNSAFYNDKMLYKVVIPATVEDISTSAFENCYYLEEVQFDGDTFERGVWDNAFYGTRWLMNSGDLVQIGTYLYMYKGSEDTLIIPDGITGGRTSNYNAKIICYPSTYSFTIHELNVVEDDITIMFADEDIHYFDEIEYYSNDEAYVTVVATPNSTVWYDAIAHGLKVIEKG